MESLPRHRHAGINEIWKGGTRELVTLVQLYMGRVYNTAKGTYTTSLDLQSKATFTKKKNDEFTQRCLRGNFQNTGLIRFYYDFELDSEQRGHSLGFIAHA